MHIYFPIVSSIFFIGAFSSDLNCLLQSSSGILSDSSYAELYCPWYRNLIRHIPLSGDPLGKDSCSKSSAYRKYKNCLSDNDCSEDSYCCYSICNGITRCYNPYLNSFTDTLLSLQVPESCTFTEPSTKQNLTQSQCPHDKYLHKEIISSVENVTTTTEFIPKSSSYTEITSTFETDSTFDFITSTENQATVWEVTTNQAIITTLDDFISSINTTSASATTTILIESTGNTVANESITVTNGSPESLIPVDTTTVRTTNGDLITTKSIFSSSSLLMHNETPKPTLSTETPTSNSNIGFETTIQPNNSAKMSPEQEIDNYDQLNSKPKETDVEGFVKEESV